MSYDDYREVLNAEGNSIDSKVMQEIRRYRRYGLRKEFLNHFFQYKLDCFSMDQFSVTQYDSLNEWLEKAGLINPARNGIKPRTLTPLFDKLEPLGVDNPLVWAVIWTNLAYHSTICKWYMLNAPVDKVYDKDDLVFIMLNVPADKIYDKNDLIFIMGNDYDYSKSISYDAVTALLDTFRNSPIGSVLKQGIVIGSSNSFRKQGWNTPDAVAILYALYMWAEATGWYTFTLGHMEAARSNSDVKGVDPVSIFGINADRFKDILQDISMQFDKYIRVYFQDDLDDVKLFPEYSSLNIINLAIKR